MEYAAFKRPFSDWKKLLIGVSLYVVPFLNLITGIFASGYLFRCMQSATKGDLKLPEWENWGQLFLQGLMVMVIGLLYALPLAILLVISANTAIDSMIAAGAVQGIGALFAALGWMAIVLFLLLIVLSYLIPGALLQYAKTGRFGAAFAMGSVLREVGNGAYFSTWFVVLIISVVGSIGLGLLNALLAFTIVVPFITLAIFSFIIGVLSMTLFGLSARDRG